MKRLWASGVGLIFLLAVVARAQTSAPATTTVALPPQPADVPAQKYDAKTGDVQKTFLEKHQRNLERIKKENIQLLFLGDSITEGWTKAPDLWKERYEKYNAANSGIL